MNNRGWFERTDQIEYQYNKSQKVEFNLFRARQIYFESGDKAGNLLARYIKRRESASTIPAIRSQAPTNLEVGTD